MRAILAAVLLVSAALAGCVQQGEELNPTADADANASDDADRTDAGDASGGSGDGADEADEDDGSADASDSSGNQTSETTSDSGTEADSSEGSGQDTEEDAGSTDEPQPEPFNLTGSLSMGYFAVVGADWIGGPVEGLLGDNGLIDADHCHMANVTVPAGSNTLSVVVHDQPADPDEPGIGAYQITLHRPDGSTTEIDWVDAQTGDGSMNWSTSDPAVGNWTVETDPVGPAVNQAWTLDLTVAGEAMQPPALLQAETTC